MSTRVARIDEILTAAVKPELSLCPNPVLDHDDVLVICGGFEDRAEAVVDAAITSGCQGFCVLLVEYLPSMPNNRGAKLLSRCAGGGIRVISLHYDREDPSGFGRKVAQLFPGGTHHWNIDISAMSRLLVVQLMVALSEIGGGFQDVIVYYTEAVHYLPTEEEADSVRAEVGTEPLSTVLLLSSGVFDVTILPELASTAMPSQSVRLVTFPSFNREQLTALLSELQPSHLSLIHGIPPRPEYAWRPEAVAKLNYLSAVQHYDEYRTSTLDYRETLDALLDIYQKHELIEKLVVSPTGSKMQAVAVGILRAYLTDVQIVYPTPATFALPELYTQGIGAIHRLPLGSLPNLQSRSRDFKGLEPVTHLDS